MLRYCMHCKKDIEVSPRAVSAATPLICPECGNEIPKDSRNPEHGVAAEKSEESIGKLVAVLFNLSFIFYLAMAVLGTIGYFSGSTGLLWGTVAVSTVAYLLQCITHTTSFPLGVIFLPLGAVGGYFAFKGIPGIGLGIHAVFAIRHLVRDVFYRFIIWIIGKCAD